jgi:hypothetical protein
MCSEPASCASCSVKQTNAQLSLGFPVEPVLRLLSPWVLVVITNNPTSPTISRVSFHVVKLQADVQSIGIHAPSRVVARARRGQQRDPLKSSLATGAKFWSALKTGMERKN